MSIQAVAWAIKQDVKPAIAKLLLIVLANYADDQGKCWPSNATLARDCSYDKDHIRKALRKLEDGGWLAIQERSKDGCRTSNLLTLKLADGPSQQEPVGEGVSAQGGEGANAQGGGRIRPGGEGAGAQGGRAYSPPEPLIEPSIEPSIDSPAPAKPGVGAREENLGPEFDEWYAAYPRHIGRGQALKAYCSARRKKKVAPAALLEGAQRAAERYAKTEQQYIPHPATWLNGERWLDEAEKQAPAAAKPGQRPHGWWLHLLKTGELPEAMRSQ